jgi:hypothetical protein
VSYYRGQAVERLTPSKPNQESPDRPAHKNGAGTKSASETKRWSRPRKPAEESRTGMTPSARDLLRQEREPSARSCVARKLKHRRPCLGPTCRRTDPRPTERDTKGGNAVKTGGSTNLTREPEMSLPWIKSRRHSNYLNPIGSSIMIQRRFTLLHQTKAKQT